MIYFNLFKLSLNIKGFPINQAIYDLKKIQSYSLQALLEYQEQKKWTIFEYHIKNNPYYASWLLKKKGKKPTNWEEIPIITKKDFQIPLKERLSIGYNTSNVYINNTSGSSGQPFFFAKDKYCHAMTWALNMDRYAWHDIEYGRSLQARFYGIPLSTLKFIREKYKDVLSARIRFPVFDLSDKVLEVYLHRFKKHPFVYINGYTSSLVLFAKYIAKRGIILKDICPSLICAIPTSEVLDNIDRKTLEQAFGVPVINEYGAAELEIIAFEDKNFDWLLNEENLFIEILDENDKPLPPGEEGRIIITSLHNQAMPFIRYELGDIASLETFRKGNKRILKKLSGRTNDIAILPSGKKAPGLTFYYITKALLESGSQVYEFIIKQKDYDYFVFEYVADRELEDDMKRQIVKAMDRYLEPGLHAQFYHLEKIERTKSGKLKQFQSFIN